VTLELDVATIAPAGGPRCQFILDRSGPQPSTATLEFPYDGCDPPTPPSDILLTSEGNVLFSGILTETELQHNLTAPIMLAQFSDVRATLAQTPASPLFELSGGVVTEIEADYPCFNPAGAPNRADTVVPALDTSLGCRLLWSALDVLYYIEEHSFSLASLRSKAVFSPDYCSEPVLARLCAAVPLSLDFAGRSLLEVIDEICALCGLTMRVSFASDPPKLELVPCTGEGDPIDLDAGAPGSDLVDGSPPDVIEFELRDALAPSPESVTVDGLKPLIELTAYTGARWSNGPALQPCDLYESDLIPDFTAEELRSYEQLYASDPRESNRDLDAERAWLWHVHRRYRMSPSLDLRAFFGNSMPPVTRFLITTGFSTDAAGNAPPPEVVILPQSGNDWTAPLNADGAPIEVRLERDGTILLGEPIALSASFNPLAVRVEGIALTVCIESVERIPVKVESDNAENGNGVGLMMAARGYRKQVVSPAILRRFYPVPVPYERDDSDALRVIAEALAERSVLRPDIRANLHGLAPEIRPGNRLGYLRFDRGIGGKQKTPIALNAPVASVRRVPPTLSALVQTGGQNGR